MPSDNLVRTANLMAGIDLTRPSPSALSELVQALSHARGAPESEIEALARELEVALAHWPDQLLHAGAFDDSTSGGLLERMARVVGAAHAELDAAAVRQLFARFPAMKRLVLDEVLFVEGGWDVLLSPPSGAGLCGVDFCRCELRDEDIDALLASPLGERLTSVGLFHEGLTDAGLARLFSKPGRLGSLSLAGLSLGPECGAALTEGELPSTLRELRLNEVEAGPEAVAALTGRDWPSLRTLELADLRLPRGWFASFAEAPILRGLSDLDLGGAKIGTEGVEALAHARLQRLERLAIQGLTGRGAVALAGAAWIGELRSLFLIAPKLDGKAEAALRAAMRGSLEAGHW